MLLYHGQKRTPSLGTWTNTAIWPLLEFRYTSWYPLLQLQDPALGACIHIVPLNSVNSECDLHPKKWQTQENMAHDHRAGVLL
jgi:hypothetical protein